MKVLSVLMSSVMTVIAHSVSLSSLSVLSLTLITLNQPVLGFFGFFRRRSSMPQIMEEEITGPQGPVQMPFFPGGGASLFNPFAGRNRLFPGFGGGLFQNRFNPSQNPLPQSPPPQHTQFQQGLGVQQSETSYVGNDEPGLNTEEAENFFTLLSETDENKCISRLVCELGADPLTAGELGSSISDIIGSLSDFPVGSQVFKYNQVLQGGRSNGLSYCASTYSMCDEESYMLMRNVPVDEDNTV